MNRQKKGVGTRQMEFDFHRPKEPDRNHERGGKSFYFFDLDDNVLFLTTPIYIFHKKTGEERAVSTGEFGRHSREIGRSGPYKDYEVRKEDQTGSFRRFRDLDKKLLKDGVQPFIEDLTEALSQPETLWRGPAWNVFFHAVHNQRPISIITARGHHPDTLKEGLQLLHANKMLSEIPNYMSVFPVSNPQIRKNLGDHGESWSTAALKKQAIIVSVETAMQRYGINTGHRFGMSDDDPHNIELITEAMRELKGRFTENCFFVISTHKGEMVKQEVFVDHLETHVIEARDQPSLFEDEE